MNGFVHSAGSRVGEFEGDGKDEQVGYMLLSCSGIFDGWNMCILCGSWKRRRGWANEQS